MGDKATIQQDPMLQEKEFLMLLFTAGRPFTILKKFWSGTPSEISEFMRSHFLFLSLYLPRFLTETRRNLRGVVELEKLALITQLVSHNGSSFRKKSSVFSSIVEKYIKSDEKK